MATHPYSTQPDAFRGTSLPVDAAWAPQVPPGHTQYTWIGKVWATTQPYSTLLGCIRDENAEANKVEVKKQEQQPKKQQPQAKKQPEKAAVDVPEGTEPTVAHLAELNFVVGEIVECAKHPDADSLYIEKINLGPVYGTRQIVSGLVKYYTVEQMVGTKCLVIANFKASALRGVNSEGMVLCASDADKTNVVFVAPPATAQLGDRIVPVNKAIEFKTPATEVNPKKAGNFWGAVAPQLKTNDKGEFVFGDVLLGNADGPATATLTGCRVA